MASIVWKSGYGGNWTNTSDWTVSGSNPATHQVPGAADTAFIGVDGSANVVTFNSTGLTVGAIDEGSASSFDMLSGSLTISGQTGQSDFYGFLQVHGGTLTSGGVLDVEGVFDLYHGATLHVTNSGFVAVNSGTISGSVAVDSGALFQLGSGLATSPGAIGFSSGSIGGAGIVQVELGTTLSVTGQGTIASYAYINSSTIAGSGTLTLAGSAVFNDTYGTGNDEVGTGRTVLKSTDLINGGTISPTTIGLDQGRKLENAGTLKFLNGGYIKLGFQSGTGGTIINDANDVIAFTNNSTGINGLGAGNSNGGILDLGGTSSVINNGTIEVIGTVTNYVDTISAPLTNTSSGVLFAYSGLLDLTGGGVLAGSMGASAGAAIELGGGYFNLTGISLPSAGDMLLSAGTLAVKTGVTAAVGMQLVQDGGAISGGGLIALLNGGIFNTGVDNENGAGRTQLSGYSAVQGFAEVNLDGGRQFKNFGTLVWSGGDFNLGYAGGSGATVWNSGTASLFAITQNYGFMFDSGGTDVLINNGTIIKGGTNVNGVTAIDAPLSNTSTGVIVANTGTLAFANGGVLSGHIGAAAGAAIELAGGTFALSGTSGITPGDLLLASGALSVAQGVTAKVGAQFAQSGGTVEGNGVLVLSNGADFRAGTDIEIGSAHTFLYGASSVDAGASVNLDGGRVLFNAGTLNWNGGNFHLGYADGLGAVIENYKSASIDITGGGEVYGGGTVAYVLNLGTITNATGTATTTIGVALYNTSTGVIDVTSGTLDLTDGGVLAGAMITNSGGTLELGGGSFTVSGSSALSNGALDLAGATMVVASGTSGSTATIGAVFVQAGGLIDGPGTLTLANGAVFQAGSDEEELGGRTVVDNLSFILQGAGVDIDDGRVFENAGSLIMLGDINLGFAGGTGGTVRNDAGATLSIAEDAGVISASAGTDSFINAGTLIKSIGTGTTDIAATLTNAGTILVSTGVVDFTGGGTSAGVLIAQNNAGLEFGGGYFSIHNVSAAGTSAGFIELTAGTLGVAGSLSASLGSEFYQSGGVIGGAGVLALAGAAIFKSGTDAENGMGVTQLKSTSHVYAGAGVDLDGGRTLDNLGTMHWEGGNFSLGYAGGAGGTIINDTGATLQIYQNNGAISNSGGTNSVINKGTLITYGASATETTIGVSLTNTSTGVISARSGLLQLSGGGYLTGTITANAGATLALAGGYFGLVGGTTSVSAGEVLLSGGTIGVAAGKTASIGARFVQSGGTIAGAGALTLANGVTFQSGGNFETGTGITVLKGSSTIASGTAIFLDSGRVLDNAGSLTWTGGNIYLGRTGASSSTGSTLENGAADTFNIRQDAGTVFDGYGTDSFINSGTLIKSSGTATTTIGVTLINGGTMIAASGTIQLTGGGSSAGVLEATTHGTLDIGGGYLSIHNTSAGGDGTGVIALTGGTLGIASTLTATLGTRFLQSGGEIAGTGTLVLAGGAEFASGGADVEVGKGITRLQGQSVIDANSDIALDKGRTLENAGVLTWNGGAGGEIGLGQDGTSVGGTIKNDAGAVFDIASDAQYGIQNVAGTNGFLNAGLLETTGSATGTAFIGAAVVNTGTISAQAGMLKLDGGGSSTGILTAGKGATLDFDGGQFLISGTSVSAGTVVNAGTILISGSGDFEVATSASFDTKFVQGGGTIGGTGTLVLTKGIEYTSAGRSTELGTGVTLLEGQSVIDPNASLALDNGRTLENAGTLTWNGGAGGVIRMGQYGSGTGATIRNDAGAVFDIASDAQYGIQNVAGTNSLLNAGLLETTGSATGTAFIGIAVVNTGMISAQAGMLKLDGGGSSTGTLTAGKGATLDFDGGQFAISGTSASAGTVVNAGTILVSGSGDFEVATSASFDTKFVQGGGTIGGTGTLVLTKGIEYTSAGRSTELGTGVTLLEGQSVIDPNASLALDNGRTLENAGTLTWNGGAGGVIRMGQYGSGTGATIRNDAGAVFDIASDAQYGIQNVAGTNSLLNAGLLETTGSATGTAFIGIAVVNTGMISAQAGMLKLDGGGSSTGTLTAGKGATLDFDGGQFAISGTSASAGTVVNAGTILVSGSGDFEVATSASFDTKFVQGGGTIGGTGTLVLTKGIEYTSAGRSTELGTGVTLLEGQSVIDPNASLALDNGRTLENAGTLTWNGGAGGVIRMGQYGSGTGATIRNDAGAVFDIASDAQYDIQGVAGKDSFVNAGLLIQSAGTGTTNIDVTLINTGTVIATSGVLELTGGGSSTGVLEATSHGTLDFGGGYFSISGTNPAGDGTGIVELSGGTLGVAAGVTATINAKFVQTGGDIGGAGTLVLAKGFEFTDASSTVGTGSGSTVVESRSTIDFDTALAFDNGRTLENAGTLTWYGGAPSIIRLGAYGNNAGATIRNDAGAMFNIAGDSNYGIVAVAGTDSFINAGTLIKSAGTASNNIGVSLTNTGTVNVVSGSLDLSGGGTSSGLLTAAKGATLNVNGGTLVVSGTSASAGTVANGGIIQISGSGDFEVDTTASLDTKFLQTGGTIGGTGTLALAKGIEFNIGGQDLELGSGTTLLKGSSTIDSGAALALDNHRTLENAGTLTWNGGSSIIRMGAYGNGTGATIRNDAGAVFDITANSSYGIVVSGGTNSLINAGLLETTGAATGTTLPIAVTNTSTGTISVLSGTVNLTAAGNSLSGTLNGTQTLNLASTSTFSGLTIGGSLVVTNNGTVSQTGAVKLGDTTTAAATFTNAAGAVFDIVGDNSIGRGAAAGSVFNNVGMLAKTSGTAISGIAASVIDTGTIAIASGTLQFSGPSNSFAGSIRGAGTLAFAGGTSTLKAGTTLTTSGLAISGPTTTVALAENLAFGGTLADSGGTLALGAFGLTLSGTDTIAGTVTGTGVLSLGGKTTIAAGASLGVSRLTLAAGSMTTVTGNLTYAGTLVEGTTATLTVSSGGGVTLSANDALNGGLTIAAGGKLTNAATLSAVGTVVVGGNFTNTGRFSDAIQLTAAGGTILNSGTIASTVGTAKIGIALSAGGKLTNAATGLIVAAAATADVVQLSGANAVNLGIIGATGSAGIGVLLGAGTSTLTNFGTIKSTGVGGVAVQLQSTTDVLIDEAGSVIVGAVKGGGGTLELAGTGGSSVALGTSFASFGVIDLLAGASWTFSGANTIPAGVNFISAGALIDTGTLTLDSNSTVTGTISGAGTLVLAAGAAALNTGAVLTVSNLAMTGGSTTLGTNLVYAGSFSESAGQIAIGGKTLSLTGAVSFTGGTIAGPGTLATSGAVSLSGLGLSSNDVWSTGKLVTQTGTLTLGNSGGGGKLVNLAGATFNITGAGGIAVASGGTGTIVNQGLFEKTINTGTSVIAASVTDTGSVTVAAGTLDFTGAANSFTGTIGGAGTLEFGGGKSTITAATTISVAALSIQGSGTSVTLGESLNYTGAVNEGAGATLALGANALTLSGTNTIAGAITGTGKLSITGGVTTLGNSLAYAGGFAESGGTLSLGGKGFTLNGAVSLIGGTVAGGGAGVLASHGATSLGAFALNGGATWNNFGTVTDSGILTLGNSGGIAGHLSNVTGATFDITGVGGIAIASGGAGGIANQALLERTGTAGSSAIAAAITNTGTILVASGTLDLKGAISGTGAETIGTIGTLKLDSTVAATQTISFAGTTGALILNDPSGTGLGFAGTVAGFGGSDKLDLATFAYVTGSTPSWTQNGSSGTLTVTEGSKVAKITLFGQYLAAGFAATKDAAGDTLITYTTTPQMASIAPPHR